MENKPKLIRTEQLTSELEASAAIMRHRALYEVKNKREFLKQAVNRVLKSHLNMEIAEKLDGYYLTNKSKAELSDLMRDPEDILDFVISALVSK